MRTPLFTRGPPAPGPSLITPLFVIYLCFPTDSNSRVSRPGSIITVSWIGCQAAVTGIRQSDGKGEPKPANSLPTGANSRVIYTNPDQL